MADFLVLGTYAVFATFWMLYVTDGDPDGVAVYMSGVASAGVGTFLAIVLGKRRMKDGRKQEG